MSRTDCSDAEGLYIFQQVGAKTVLKGHKHHAAMLQEGFQSLCYKKGYNLYKLQ